MFPPAGGGRQSEACISCFRRRRGSEGEREVFGFGAAEGGGRQSEAERDVSALSLCAHNAAGVRTEREGERSHESAVYVLPGAARGLQWAQSVQGGGFRVSRKYLGPKHGPEAQARSGNTGPRKLPEQHKPAETTPNYEGSVARKRRFPSAQKARRAMRADCGKVARGRGFKHLDSPGAPA